MIAGVGRPRHGNALDAESQRWLDGLSSHGRSREQCTADLHALLLRAARYETARRRHLLAGAAGPELDDIAHQAAGDAVLAITRSLDTFRGSSRFTTWAYVFVIHEVSQKTRRHLWSGRRVPLEEVDWERLPNRLGLPPHRDAEAHAQLAALRVALDEALTLRQRQVFVAVALNEVPIDAIAAHFGTSRGAIYKTLHDARSRLRVALAAAGFPLGLTEPQP
jgi:RNA polymerase sigma-70 factor (ECF subfamily)